MTLDDIEALAKAQTLTIVAALHPEDQGGTVLLLGPDEPAFWPVFSTSPEFSDQRPNPLDRWSKRVISGLGDTLGMACAFPSDGPPYPPFVAWALASGQVWQSPVQLLLHGKAGLFLSFRGALICPERLPLPAPADAPCNSCDRPCTQACPAGALSPEGYDVPACKAYLQSPDGKDCLTQGCRVRRACPLSQSYGRLPTQSAFHMRAFL